MSNLFENLQLMHESQKHLTEGGIYPVVLYDDAVDEFENKIDKLLSGNNEVSNLELIPALGFGGSGRYYYKAKIELSNEAIEKFINETDTPLAYELLKNDELKINMYSDIEVTCSADEDSYHDGVTLDSTNDSININKLDKEANKIGSKIIDILRSHEDELVNYLRGFEILDEDE